MINYTRENKKIAINSIIIYIRMGLVVLIGLFTSRFILQALGVSDYGLFNVVGGIISLLGIIGIAMHTTTRRYINVEMGLGERGNLNKIFNVSIIIHICISLLLLLIGLTFGLWYIANYLNVSPDKYEDAVFVFIASTVVSSISFVAIPFHGLMSAFEEFKWLSAVDILFTVLKVPLVFFLFVWPGNVLRFYTISTCLLTLLTDSFRWLFCYVKYKEIIRFKFYRDKQLYKEIFAFNNYTAIGAMAYISRSQGCPVIVNYFFGTVVNGAFAISMMIENYVVQFVNNLNTASIPQITQYYASGNLHRTFSLANNVTRYSILLMLVLTFSLWIELNTILSLWLGNVPEGALLFCQWMLLSLFLRSFTACLDPIIQATGKVKWYQISCSSILLAGLPIAVYLYYLDFPAYTIIVVFTIVDFAYKVAQILFLKRYTSFSFFKFVKDVLVPVLKVCIAVFVYWIVYSCFDLDSLFLQLIGLFCTFVATSLFCYLWGLNYRERMQLLNGVAKFYLRVKKM